MIKSNYIVHDAETGGLDENKNPITQYAVVVLDGRTLKEIDRWETFVKPQGDEKINLGACCERAKIKLTDAHGAMNDVEATADLLRWFMKKLRAKKGEGVADELLSGRARGNEFFEFKCGAK